MADIPWLGDVLRAAGCSVIEEGDWTGRGSGSFDPIGVLWHHTASVSTPDDPAPSLEVVINGRPDLSGPLCHALVDYYGVFRLIADGQANHAGESGGSGPIPAGDGNAMLIGWEIDYAGDGDETQSMTAAQYSASVLGTAAVLQHLGRSADHARGHRETSVTGKIDPSFVDLDQMRADVAARMNGQVPGDGEIDLSPSELHALVVSVTASVLRSEGVSGSGDAPLMLQKGIRQGMVDANLWAFRSEGVSSAGDAAVMLQRGYRQAFYDESLRANAAGVRRGA